MLIQKIRKSRITKPLATVLAVLFLEPIANLYKLRANTGGPTQPEFSKYTAVGASDLVDPFTGNVGYSVPLFDIGGYPVTLSYSGDIHPQQDAGWVGLGWSLNLGSINRALRGVPDDFNGDIIQQTTYQKPHNISTVNVSTEKMEWFINKKDGNTAEKKTNQLKGNFELIFDNYTGFGYGFGVSGSKSKSLHEIWHDKDTNNVKKIHKMGFTKMLDDTTLMALASKKGSSVQMNGGLSYNTKGGYTSQFGFQNESWLLKHIGGIHLNYNSNAGRMSTGNYLGVSNNNLNAAYTPNFLYIPQIISPRNNFLISDFKINVSVSSSTSTVRKKTTLDVFMKREELERYSMDCSSYGFLYNRFPTIGKSNGDIDKYSILDFQYNGSYTDKYTRELSTAQNTYDVFNISAAGVGGSFRLFSNSLVLNGPVLSTKSVKNAGVALGMELAKEPEGGADLGVTISKYKYGPLENKDFERGNELEIVNGFRPKGQEANNPYIQSEFRNDFEFIETQNDYNNSINKNNLMQFNVKPKYRLNMQSRFKSEFKLQDGTTSNIDGQKIARTSRQPKQQVVSFFTADQATNFGLMQRIPSYHFDQFGNPKVEYNPATKEYQMQKVTIDRRNLHRKGHHISEFTVLQPDGTRYYFGTPVYSLSEKQYSFTVESGTQTNDKTNKYSNRSGLVEYFEQDLNNNNKGIDNYYSKRVIPAYATTYLLNAVLSADYVDKSNDGISDDDLGNFVKFNYSLVGGFGNSILANSNTFPSGFGWKDAMNKGVTGYLANLSQNTIADKYDDKGSFTYGIKELWYMHSIESKDLIAFFYLGDRQDAYSVEDINGTLATGKKNMKYLKKVVIYAKNDFKLNGNNAVPIKTIHLEYAYDLCKNYPMNKSLNPDGLKHPITGSTIDLNKGGKLTLYKIWFTYGKMNVPMAQPYVFNYNTLNPDYATNATDRWGTINYNSNPISDNIDELEKMTYPYTDQSSKTNADHRSSAWMLSDIQLPSGGKIHIEYESDDYAYVQDEMASTMVKVVGISNQPNLNPTDGAAIDYLYSDKEKFDLFDNSGKSASNEAKNPNRNFLIIQRPNNNVSIKDMISNDEMLYFNFKVQLNATTENEPLYEPITGFSEILDLGDIPNSNLSYIKLKQEKAGIWPVSAIYRMAVQQGLAKAPFIFSPASDNRKNPPTAKQIAENILGSYTEQLKMYLNRIKYPQSRNLCKRADLNNSYVRLRCANGFKFGGGHRVKSVSMSDNWAAMTNNEEPEQNFTTYYNYTKVDEISKKVISSGVASYEPFVGGDENTLVKPKNFKVSRLKKFLTGVDSAKVQREFKRIGPQVISYDLDPIGEEFYPSAIVGYSKITITTKYPDDIALLNSNLTKKVEKHKTGRTELEFYTARDFPVFTDRTELLKRQTRITGPRLSGAFSKKNKSTESESGETSESKKSVWYPGISTNLINSISSQGFIIEINDMHGKPKSNLVYTEDSNEPFSGSKFYYKMDNNGKLVNNIDVIDKTGAVHNAEFGVNIEPVLFGAKSTETKHSIGLDFNVDVPGSVPVLSAGFNYDLMRSSNKTITVTKHVRRSGLLDSIVVFDKGAVTTTKNLAWDAETGQVLLTRHWNEFRDAVYGLVKPAHWMYEGLQGAYKNIDLVVNLDPTDGVANDPTGLLVPGDELIWNNRPGYVQHYWILDKINNNVSIIDETGQKVSDIADPEKTGAEMFIYKLRVIRSGHRNIFGLAAETIKLMKNPIASGSLVIDKDWVLGSSAITYDDTRQVYSVDRFCWGKLCYQTYDPETESFTTHISTNFGGCGDLVNPSDNEVNPFNNLVMSNWTDGFVLGAKYNPYIIGTKGVWKPFDGYVYDDKQDENNQRLQNGGANPNETNIRYDGLLVNFQEFWYKKNNSWLARTQQHIFNPWNWTERLKWLDEKGNATQTTNVLDVPGSSLFAFNDRRLPVATSANAKINEMLFDGFEEIGTDISLNFNCNQSIDLTEFNKVFSKQVWHWPLAQILVNEQNSISSLVSHTGWNSLKLGVGSNKVLIKPGASVGNSTNTGILKEFTLQDNHIIPHFYPELNKKYVISFWVKEAVNNQFQVDIKCLGSSLNLQPLNNCDSKPIYINGWKKMSYSFIPTSSEMELFFINSAINNGSNDLSCYLDDLRIHPSESSFTSYVYDYRNYKLMATLDDNNFAVLYQYNIEGALIRKNIETAKGVYTSEESFNSLKK